MPAIIRNRPRTAQLAAAIEAWDAAHDAFIDLAVDAAEFAGDPEYDAKFDEAEHATRVTTLPLRNLLRGCKPVVYRDRLYDATRGDDWPIRRTDVQVIHETGR